ncbi:hypothetical protein FA15DRAFT_711344 [Coprinopsis marcescibilis]|uniref:Uncharacterized protein n=1 Tax=Coprinopsis marcescibilis TaxID=230819 RepID=A0A5C3K9W5_COPMA|nr:hypothetical protein FA15DRAFT_711344 [Coprinopsis marcescibilis]
MSSAIAPLDTPISSSYIQHLGSIYSSLFQNFDPIKLPLLKPLNSELQSSQTLLVRHGKENFNGDNFTDYICLDSELLFSQNQSGSPHSGTAFVRFFHASQALPLCTTPRTPTPVEEYPTPAPPKNVYKVYLVSKSNPLGSPDSNTPNLVLSGYGSHLECPSYQLPLASLERSLSVEEDSFLQDLLAYLRGHYDLKDGLPISQCLEQDPYILFPEQSLVGFPRIDKLLSNSILFCQLLATNTPSSSPETSQSSEEDIPLYNEPLDLTQLQYPPGPEETMEDSYINFEPSTPIHSASNNLAPPGTSPVELSPSPSILSAPEVQTIELEEQSHAPSAMVLEPPMEEDSTLPELISDDSDSDSTSNSGSDFDGIDKLDGRNLNFNPLLSYGLAHSTPHHPHLSEAILHDSFVPIPPILKKPLNHSHSKPFTNNRYANIFSVHQHHIYEALQKLLRELAQTSFLAPHNSAPMFSSTLRLEPLKQRIFAAFPESKDLLYVTTLVSMPGSLGIRTNYWIPYLSLLISIRKYVRFVLQEIDDFFVDVGEDTGLVEYVKKVDARAIFDTTPNPLLFMNEAELFKIALDFFSDHGELIISQTLHEILYFHFPAFHDIVTIRELVMCRLEPSMADELWKFTENYYKGK